MTLILLSVILFFLHLMDSSSSSSDYYSAGNINNNLEKTIKYPNQQVNTNIKIHSEQTTEAAAEDVCNNGHCVPFHLCVNDTIIQDGEGLIDIRSSGVKEPRYCDGSYDVCCKLKNYKEYGGHPPDRLGALEKPKQLCGIRNTNVNTESRIIGGEIAEYTEFSWMIAVLTIPQGDSTKLNYKCGGSLIHPSVVLTAAHCVDSVSSRDLRIRAGEWDTRNAEEKWTHQDRNVSEIILHENYYRAALHNDIALLILIEPIELTPNINVVCLPPAFNNFDNQRCLVTGWGKDNYGKQGQFQAILKKVEVPIVPRLKCEQLFQNTRLGKFFHLHDSILCAGGEFGKDACKGDGGSPMVCQSPHLADQYFQVGIVAWGIGCKESSIPGGYVDVAKFRPWVDRHMVYRGFNTNYYNHNPVN